jgi:two-component system, response regulator PdtaR
MSEASKRIILVLDDDKIQHLILRKRIAVLKVNIELIFFEDANSALDYIETSPPEIIISDINLHKLDGWQFLEKVKELRFLGKFFLLTGSILQEDRVRANKDSSVSGFFEKPIQESDLIYILGL